MEAVHFPPGNPVFYQFHAQRPQTIVGRNKKRCIITPPFHPQPFKRFIQIDKLNIVICEMVNIYRRSFRIIVSREKGKLVVITR